MVLFSSDQIDFKGRNVPSFTTKTGECMQFEGIREEHTRIHTHTHTHTHTNTMCGIGDGRYN